MAVSPKAETTKAGTAPKKRRPPILHARHAQIDVTRLDQVAAERVSAWRRQIYRSASADLAGSTLEARRTLASAVTAEWPLNLAQWALVALTETLQPVVDALEEWTAEEQLAVVDALVRRYEVMIRENHFNLNLVDVTSWIEAHDNGDDRSEALAHCIDLDAPSEVRIERRLAQAGSQKRVFKAQWTVADDPTDIAVKQFLSKSELILIRERRPHPLSMTHPNIIETFTIANQASTPETFLIERWIDVLDDDTKAAGWDQAARLLVDMARALAFLTDQGLVHGDVKPDNIGYHDGRFILLDFGICRPAGQFASATQTGSLRTRAPEVLVDERSHTAKSDVWSLGATVFNFLFQRFPLFKEHGETVPKVITDPEGRSAFEKELRERADNEFVALLGDLHTLKHRALRELLIRMLDRDPDSRPDARWVLQEALRTLGALVGVQDGPRFGALQELEELHRHLASDERDISLLPKQKADDLATRVALLSRELNAQRHHERASERVSLILQRLELDPDATLDPDGAEAAVSFIEIAKQYELPEDRRSADLLSTVRGQLALRDQERVPDGHALAEELRRVMRSKVAVGYADGELQREANELLGLLPK